MGKRISSGLLIAVLFVLLSAAAPAESSGLFAWLAQSPLGDSRLAAVDEAADDLGLAWTTDDGITVRIEQAYFEGNRVFIAYRLSGGWCTTVLHEGAPEGEIRWNQEEETIAAQTLISDIPERQQALQQLDGNGQRWIECTDIGLHDGLSLPDGTYLDIIGGDNLVEEDGSLIGWKECEIPEDCLAETLTFRAELYRNRSIQFQDGAICRLAVERGEQSSFDFTLTQHTDCVRLSGEGKGPDYTAAAELTAGRIDMRGRVTVTCPAAWVEVWETWENDEGIDLIEDWVLYRGGEAVDEAGVQGIDPRTENQLSFELLYPLDGELDQLSLVPVYNDGEPRTEEAIPLSVEEY